MNKHLESIYLKLNEYKKKYYTNALLKGSLIGGTLLLSAFLFITFFEYFGRFNSVVRLLLLLSFIGLLLYVLAYYIFRPIYQLLNLDKAKSYEQTAKEIGRFFPEIKDKLVNTLQLSQLGDSGNELLEASIQQKSNELRFIRFADAVNFNENRKYLKYFLPPLVVIFLISAISPSILKNSTERIVYFKKNFAEKAPFTFKIKNRSLKAVQNEDYTLELELIGNVSPENVLVVYNNRKFKMNQLSGKNYSFNFSKVSDDIDFFFNASGFDSNEFTLDVVAPPSLVSFDVELDYPAYLNKEDENLSNVGNFTIPEGTIVHWNFNTSNTSSLGIKFDADSKIQNVASSLLKNFSYQRKLKNSTNYKLFLKNDDAANSGDISYFINVTPDNYPQLQLNQLQDSTLFNYILLGGNISDDYGLNKFKLFYRKSSSTETASENFKALDIPFNAQQNSQSFYYQFPLQALQLVKGDKLEYYLQLWDNDGVNGSKSTKSSVFTFALPSISEFEKEVGKDIDKTEENFEKLLKKSKELKKNLDEVDKKLKAKKEVGFQEKKDIEELLKKKEELQNDVQNLQQQLQNLQEKQSRFNEPSPRTQEKMQQLQNLLNELLSTEDKKLFEQLKELLEKNKEENVSEKINELKKNERNLDRNIDRTMKQFKNLQLQIKVDEVAKELEKLAQKQEELADKTKDEKNPENLQNLEKKQEEIKKEFEQEKEKLNAIEKLSKELKKELDTKKDEQKEVEKQQDKAKQEMKDQKSAESAKSQKKAAKSMRNMASQLMEQMETQEMKEAEIDIDALRDILDNLVKLSFDQERVMNGLKNLNSSDPRFVDLSQDQLKLTDDAKMIEDSLYSLAKRVMQIEAFITKEVTQMNNNLTESSQLLKDRKLPQAASKQQFSMTHINNLALLLSDTFKQMQQMMMAMSGEGEGKGKGKKPGSSPSPGLGESQKGLNQRLEQLGKNGAGGRQLSEELGKLSQEQAKLRQQLKELQDRMNGTQQGKKIGGELQELQQLMDESENDMVNKRINPMLLKRQQDIQTRLLEAEKAIKEQELDPVRKSKTGLTFQKSTPPSLEEFLKLKQKSVELIRTTPPNYTPFYKSQTDKYFKKIN